MIKGVAGHHCLYLVEFHHQQGALVVLTFLSKALHKIEGLMNSVVTGEDPCTQNVSVQLSISCYTFTQEQITLFKTVA